jgi:hypothetical protein
MALSEIVSTNDRAEVVNKNTKILKTSKNTKKIKQNNIFQINVSNIEATNEAEKIYIFFFVIEIFFFFFCEILLKL